MGWGGPYVVFFIIFYHMVSVVSNNICCEFSFLLCKDDVFFFLGGGVRVIYPFCMMVLGVSYDLAMDVPQVTQCEYHGSRGSMGVNLLLAPLLFT